MTTPPGTVKSSMANAELSTDRVRGPSPRQLGFREAAPGKLPRAQGWYSTRSVALAPLAIHR